MKGDLVILATRSMKHYNEKVLEECRKISNISGSDIVHTGSLKTSRFADGEMEVDIQTSIRGKDVYLLASCARNPDNLSVEENKIELYHTIDALKRAQPGKITLVEPYMSSSRSDRTTRRNSVGFWVHYKLLVSLGVDHIITYQLHSDKSKTAVDPTLCAIDDVPISILLKRYITDTFIKTKEKLESEVADDWLFCSVDAGGEGIAKKYATGFGAGLVIAHKQRDYSKVNTVDSVNILSAVDIKDKVIWIVDDMIDTGGSVYRLVKELCRRGVKSVSIAAVHPVLSDPAVDRLKELWHDGHLKDVIVTDTVLCSEYIRKELPFVHVVSSAKLTSRIINSLHASESLSRFFSNYDAKSYLETLKLFI